jgi:hypothetical protein
MFPLCQLSVFSCPFYGVTPEGGSRSQATISPASTATYRSLNFSPAAARRFRRCTVSRLILAHGSAGPRPTTSPCYADFATRYMPTANASMVNEGGFPDEATCLKSVSSFLDRVRDQKFLGHTFWCWAEAPAAFWAMLEQRPA